MLLQEKSGGDALLDGTGGHEDTPFAMFGTGARMDADTGTAGYVADQRHRTLKARRAGHAERIDQSRYEAIGILQSAADGYLAGGVTEVEVAGDGFAERR